MTKLFYVGLYLAFLVLLLEGCARLVLSVEPLFQRIIGRDEVSWRLRWVRAEPGTRVAFYDAIDMFDPVRGWTLMPLLRGYDSAGRKLNSNRRGLRGVREYDYRKPAGVSRILVFGDSYTFGEETSDDQTYAAFLGQDLPGTEVLNFGVHGYGHDQMLLYYKEEGCEYEADVVVLGFVGEDMERNVCNFWHRAKPRYVLRGGALRLTGSPVPKPEEVLAAEARRMKGWELAQILWGRVLWGTGLIEKRKESITTALLDDFARRVREQGAVPLYVHIPTPHELADYPGQPPSEEFFVSYVKGRDIPHLLLRPYFRAYEEAGTPLKKTRHWDATGHQIIARGLKDYLQQEGLLSP